MGNTVYVYTHTYTPAGFKDRVDGVARVVPNSKTHLPAVSRLGSRQRCTCFVPLSARGTHGIHVVDTVYTYMHIRIHIRMYIYVYIFTYTYKVYTYIHVRIRHQMSSLLSRYYGILVLYASSTSQQPQKKIEKQLVLVRVV